MPRFNIFSLIVLSLFLTKPTLAQEKPLEKLRVGGGSASATQLALWFAKEGGYYEKQGLKVEAVSIPGSSLALQAMLSGELPILQLGGAASIQANLSGADTVIVADGTSCRHQIHDGLRMGISENFKIVATIVRKFVFWIYGRPEIGRMEDLKGKVFGTTRFGSLSDLASRFALRLHGIDPEHDITMVQTGGPAETVAAMLTGKVQAAALTPPATLQAKKVKFKELLDMSKLDAEYHINGVVTTRHFLKSNEDTVRRFLRAYIEGTVRAQRDKAFALKTMAKMFRTNDPEVLEESYDMIVKSNFAIPPYPSLSGIASLIQVVEKTNPKAKGAKPEDFADGRLVREIEQSGFIKSVLAER